MVPAMCPERSGPPGRTKSKGPTGRGSRGKAPNYSGWALDCGRCAETPSVRKGSLVSDCDGDSGLAPSAACAWLCENAISFDDAKQQVKKQFSFVRSKHRQNFLLSRVKTWPGSCVNFLPRGGQPKKVRASVFRIGLTINQSPVDELVHQKARVRPIDAHPLCKTVLVDIRLAGNAIEIGQDARTQGGSDSRRQVPRQPPKCKSGQIGETGTWAFAGPASRYAA